MEIAIIASGNQFFYIYLIYKVTRSIRRSPGLTTKCLVIYTPPEEPASQQLFSNLLDSSSIIFK